MKRTSHGMILGEGGVKMSKSLGNVINPNEIVKIYGADTLRVYEMFMGPFDQAVAWSDDAIIGPRRFLERVWNLQSKVEKNKNYNENGIQKLIKKVSEDIEAMKFNTAISSLMIFINENEKLEKISKEEYEIFLKLLSPFAPHMTEEIWNMLGHSESLTFEAWPVANEALAVDENYLIPVQINGKIRAKIIVPVGTRDEDVLAQAMQNENVQKYVTGKEVVKQQYVPGRIAFIVVKDA
jgi:leucyl-tRNA synthetase